MYTLRIITETRTDEKSPFEQVIENYWLGDEYHVLRKGITNKFDLLIKENHPKIKKDDIKALLYGVGALEFLLKESSENETYSYFIMTESGKTFEKL